MQPMALKATDKVYLEAVNGNSDNPTCSSVSKSIILQIKDEKK